MARTKELECVKYEIDDEGIAWVTFNRPEKRNAMNPELHFNMQAVIAELETDDDAKVLVITGAGDAWSSGMDLREFSAPPITIRRPDSRRNGRTAIGRSFWPPRKRRPSPWSTAIVSAALFAPWPPATS